MCVCVSWKCLPRICSQKCRIAGPLNIFSDVKSFNKINYSLPLILIVYIVKEKWVLLSPDAIFKQLLQFFDGDFLPCDSP